MRPSVPLNGLKAAGLIALAREPAHIISGGIHGAPCGRPIPPSFNFEAQ